MRAVLLLCAVVLAGCTLRGGDLDKPAVAGAEAGANPITGDAVEVSTLAAPGAADAAAVAPNPAASAAPAAAAVEPPVAEDPAPVVLPEELACLKKGGQWAAAGNVASKACVQRTKDGGKFCRKESDCDGYCLATSNTCAPVTPLFGCNDILQDNGVRVTLCID